MVVAHLEKFLCAVIAECDVILGGGPFGCEKILNGAAYRAHAYQYTWKSTDTAKS